MTTSYRITLLPGDGIGLLAPAPSRPPPRISTQGLPAKVRKAERKGSRAARLPSQRTRPTCLIGSAAAA